MRHPFFSKTLLSVVPDNTSLEPKCGSCGLYKACKTPKMGVTGKGRRKTLVVVDMPTSDDDQRGKFMSGPTGMKLTSALRKGGYDLKDDCWITGALVCRPNKEPGDKATEYCRPNLLKTIKTLNPEKIILLGDRPIKSLIGWLWKDTKTGGVLRWGGYRIPSIRLNAWIYPTFNPVHLLYNDCDPVMDMMFRRHVEDACKTEGRPHETIPDYDSMCKIELDANRAAEAVAEMVMTPTTPGGIPKISFDYETTTLKPDGPHAEIYSCSVSDGRTSIAFPWRGAVIPLMRRILPDPRIQKIGQNTKFEARWTWRKLGVEVNGWFWDDMLASHAMENATRERHVTGIKFQAFVKLGVGAWDKEVEPYLKTDLKEKGGNAPNRIKECDLRTVLHYNALDSLYEYLIARIQYKEFRRAITNHEEE